MKSTQITTTICAVIQELDLQIRHQSGRKVTVADRRELDTDGVLANLQPGGDTVTESDLPLSQRRYEDLATIIEYLETGVQTKGGSDSSPLKVEDETVLCE